MRSSAPGTGVLIVLHGHGDDASSAREWGRRLAPSGWEIVAPEADFDTEGVASWFSTGARGVDVDELHRSAARVAEVVGRERGSGRPVVVVGFSQGAALALSLGLVGCRPDAVVSVCGFLPEIDAPDVGDLLGIGREEPPTLLLGTDGDAVVPAFMSLDAASLLAAAGRPVTAEVLGGGHEVGPLVSRRAREWLTRITSQGVRVSVGLPVERTATGVELVSGEAIAELAAAYERLGFDAAYVTDHPAPDDRWLAGGGHHAMEPAVALAVAAAATRRLLLHTNVYVLPYRNPFLAAKSLASLDVVSGGRLIVGVAAGYLRAEFDALGAGFDDRTARLEDALEIIPRVWADSGIGIDGPGYVARSVTAEPRPVQVPHPPIWVGGNSRAAMRRAVTMAQGWCPFPTPGGMERAVRTSAIADLDDLRRALDRARDLCDEVERSDPLTVCFVPFATSAYLSDPDSGMAPLVDEVHELEALGVDWVALSVPGDTRSEVIDRSEALAAALGLT